MSLHKQPDLKVAILQLPPKEKDKLLVRLIGKDKLLMKQLHFQLLENEAELEQRINSLRERLIDMLSPSSSGIKNTAMYSNYKSLIILLRQASGMINEHEKVTKDKFSEVEFRLLILQEAFKHYPNLFVHNYILIYDKLRRYVEARLKTTHNKYHKLHEDLQFDLQEHYSTIMEFARENNLETP